MNHFLIKCFSLLAAANAFQLPSSIPTRHSSLSKTASVGISTSSNSAFSATALHGKLWKRLEIEEDGPEDGTSWYLINCIAGVEKDLLNQIRYVCEQKNFPITDVEKFVVPTERHLRSHGDKKKVVDVKVRYPGYVFCKIRLIEDVYETLQELELARSWMGTVNKKGHKKLPPAPLPLNDDEVKKFKGLEEAQELFEDMFGNDYSGRSDTGADLLAQYEGYDVGQMVKILRGNFDGEDGTIRRLKGGQLMVRLFTYGQVFDEWFDPDAIRPLSDLEVMRGMSGPTVPVDQDQFDVSIGKKDPTTLEGPAGGNMPERSGLMQNAGSGPERNRREDRVARGETGSRDMLGRTPAEMKTEEQNWLAYREEQRAGQGGGGGGSDMNMPPVQEEPVMKREPFRPPKGSKGDTWGITARSSWDGGEYGFEADSEQEERERKDRTAEAYKGRVPTGRGRRDERDTPSGGRGDFGDRRERDTRERRPVRDRDDREDNRAQSSPSKADDDSANNEDDFFNSLMSELSDDLSDDSSESGSRSPGARRHDNAGPSAAKPAEKSSGTEDSFFENLMSELGSALDDTAAPSSSEKGKKKLDDDDFFSSLEAELSESLGDSGNFGSGKESEEEESSDDDDFFASLQKEMGKALDESPEKVDEALQDDFFSSLIDDVADELEMPAKGDEASQDDFFSSLIDDVAVQETSNKQTSSENHSDYTSLTVPALKDLLRSKGLKVGGKKAELIERLQSQS
mmetsp:Transcript_8805/g.16075  ORF Transcript_8805/g.16075 Transcript_8805/m.16075 type:complete len:740 (-) Transcript_8805:72-2291(-)